MFPLSNTLAPLKLGGLPNTTFPFDPTLCTFTPAMAKRVGKVFAGAPIVQGKWDGSGVSDAIDVGRGAVISGTFYSNIDCNQGTIVFWITPEWNGNDGLYHIILGNDGGAGNQIRIQKSSAGILALVKSSTEICTVNVNAWVAGTAYCVVVRWDGNNKIDGTNYTCISVNDSNTFGATSAPGLVIDNIRIGRYSNDSSSADAILSGLTIYRRVLYDGAYGVDVGNGDEIAQIYNAGTGADPCSITGSWDVCFCLPTDASVGTLATTGQAWSHPHGSEIIVDPFCQTTYGSSAWATVGTPSTGPADLATADKIYQWGYKWTSDAADEGITQTKAGLTANTNYVVRPVLHYDATARPIIKILDATNGDAVITSITCPDQTAQLVTNPTFDSDTTGWTASAGATLASITGGQSNNCLQITNGATNYGIAYQLLALQPNARYRISLWHKNGTSFGSVAVGLSVGGTELLAYKAFNDVAWTQHTYDFSTTSSGIAYLWLGNTNNVLTYTTLFDEISLTRVVNAAHPWSEPFTFHLPTVVMEGAAADSTSIKVQVLNTTAAGVTYLHQVEVLANLVVNPNFVSGSGDPWIPSDWVNGSFALGELAQDNTSPHSGTYALKVINPGGTRTAQMSSGYGTQYAFYGEGVWLKKISGTWIGAVDDNGKTYIHNTLSTALNFITSGNGWTHNKGVGRNWQGSFAKERVVVYSGTYSALIGDAYQIALTPITLTVTPASLANSTESSGVRVDGGDTYTQPITAITATKGTIKWKWTPRHNAADSVKFGAATPFILHARHASSNNGIRLFWQSGNILQLDFYESAGIYRIGTWNATGAIAAGTTYDMQIQYTSTGMTLSVNGTVCITLSYALDFAPNLPLTMYWGSVYGSTALNVDSTFAIP